MNLTVVCVFVKGPYPYTPEYVIRLEKMVRKHLKRPFKFVCLTDRPELLPSIECIRIEPTLGSPESFGYWTKLRLFDPSIGLTGRVLFLDLDVLVVGDLEPIVNFTGPFSRLSLIDDAASLMKRGRVGPDRYGRLFFRRFNSSVMVFNGDDSPKELFTDWTPWASKVFSGDQDWIGARYVSDGDLEAMPEKWFPRLSLLANDEQFAATGGPMPEEARVILCKKPKNHEAVERWPWFDAMWGGE